MVSAKIVHIFSPCRIECQTERIKELLPDKILYARFIFYMHCACRIECEKECAQIEPVPNRVRDIVPAE